MKPLRSWLNSNCRYAQDAGNADLSVWHTPKFEQATKLVESYNNLDNFTYLGTAIRNLVKKVQTTPLPQNREYAKVMGIISQLDQLRPSIDGQAKQAKQLANEGQDVSPMLTQMQGIAGQIPPLVDQVFQSIQKMTKRTKAPQKGVVAQVTAPTAPAADPMASEWQSMAPPAPAPTPPVAAPVPAVPKPKPMPTPKMEPTLFEGAIDPEQAYNEVIPLLNAVKQKAQAAMEIRKIDHGAQLNQMQSLFEKGKDGLFWYDKIAGELNKRLGPDGTKMFLNFVAATSPRMPVMRNLEQAIKAYNQYMSGQEFSGFMRTHVPNIMKAYKGEELSGAKVNNFAKAMGGDASAVTLDVWMARAFGMDKDQFNPKQYEVLSEAIRELAGQAGVEPRQYQAAVWTGIKREQGSKLSADPIDQMMETQWGKFKQDFLKYKGNTKPSPSDFQLTASTVAWIKRNCDFL